MTASNANSFPVTLDVPIGAAGQVIETDGQGVGRVDGIFTWSPQLLPGGKAELRYRYLRSDFRVDQFPSLPIISCRLSTVDETTRWPKSGGDHVTTNVGVRVRVAVSR